MIRNYYIPILLFSMVLIGCSSKETMKKEGTSTTKTEEKKETPSTRQLTLEMREREYIKTNKIKSIEKVRFIYDRTGNPVSDGKLSATFYDKNGLSTRAVFYGKNEKTEMSYVYKNENGKRIETTQYDKDNKNGDRFTYDYDAKGNKVKSTRYSSDGKMENYYTYKYNDDSNLIEEIWYSADGKVEYKIIYKYDDGLKTESISYDEKGEQIKRVVFKYDDKGNIVEEVQYEGSKPLSLIQYIYKH